MSTEGAGLDGQSGSYAQRTTVSVEHTGRAVVVRVAGEIDLLTAPKLEEAVLAAYADQPAILVLDLGEVTFLASAGLAVISTIHQRNEAGTALRVVAGRRALRPLELTGLAGELQLYPSVTEALDNRAS